MICPHFLRSTQSKYRYQSVSYSFILSIFVTFSFVQIHTSHSGLDSAKVAEPDIDAVGRAREDQARPLKPGRPIERGLAGGQSHHYRLILNAGQYLRLTVEQRGIDVVVQLCGSDSEPILVFDSESRRQGQESASMVAETTGEYLVTIQPKLDGAAAGRYEIRIEETRAATEKDRELQYALKLYAESIRLYKAGKYHEAFPLATSVLEIRKRLLGAEDPDVARALTCLANLHRHYKEDRAQAEPLYQQALTIFEKTLGPEHPGFASALNSLAMLFRNQGDYTKAMPLVERALAIREQTLGPEDPDVATSLNSLAILYIERGQYAKAEPLYQRTLAIRERTLGPEHLYVSYALNNLANLYRDRGEYAKAKPLYQRSLAIREKVLEPGHSDIAVALVNLAILYWAKGEYTKAEPLYQRTLTIQERDLGPDHPYVAESLNNLANFYRDRGDYAMAKPLYQRALAIREKVLGPEHSSVAESLNNLAVFYKERGEYAKAEPLDQRALTIREKVLGPDHPHVAQSLTNLADIYLSQGELAKAESLYQRALAIQEHGLGPEHPDVAITLDNLALLYQKRGEYAKAESFYRRALAIQERGLGPEHPEVAQSLNYLAILQAIKGGHRQAVALQSRANTISEHHLTLNLASGSERQKLAYLARYSTQTDFTLSLHNQVAPDDQEALDLAFTTLLRRKGRVMDAMINTIAPLQRHATPQDQQLFDQLIEARSQLAALIFRGGGSGQPEIYRSQLQLEKRVEDLEAILSTRSAGFRAQVQPVTLSEVQAALPPDGLLVEFVVYNPQDLQTGKNKPPCYLAFLLGPNGRPRWVDLGEIAPIDRAITDWRRSLRDPRRMDVNRLARDVDEKVMRPVRASMQSIPGKIPGKPLRLFIAPAGLLNLVPFAALVDQRGSYLVERYAICYLMSGRDLLRLQVRQPAKQGAVIMADPDYGENHGTVLSMDRDVGLPSKLQQSASSNLEPAQIYFPPLRGTRGEAQALKVILPQAKVLTRGQATETALKQLSSPSLLHVATHGFFLQDQDLRSADTRGIDLRDGDLRGADLRGGAATSQVQWPSDLMLNNPLLRSGLALAGVNLRESRIDQEDDGVLTALEAAGLDLWGTKLVVLSACDTGVGEVKNGEGVYGLRRALVLAGSETQVMSLWPVSDLGTRDLMVSYYKALQRGDGRSGGLRQVQLQMLRRKDRRHPFYWAGFIQSGEWANLEGQR